MPGRTYIPDNPRKLSEGTMKTERFEMRVDPAWLKKLDEIRRREEDVPTRAEVLRRLVDEIFQQRVQSAA